MNRIKLMLCAIALVLTSQSSWAQTTDETDPAVSLPFVFDGGLAEVNATPGMSQTGLGPDYTGEQKLNFNDELDALVIHFNEQAAAISFKLKGKNSHKGTFAIEQSTDGVQFISSQNDDIIGINNVSANKYSFKLNSETRYVRLIYSKKLQGEVALGNIRIYNHKLTVGTTGWTTYYTEEDVEIPWRSPIKGIIVTKNADGQYELVKKYDGETDLYRTIPAGTPLIINAPAGEYTLKVGDTDNKAPSGNYLHGQLKQGTVATVGEGYYYYKLAKDQAGNIGWYFGAEDGGPFSMGGFKAYLALPISESGIHNAPSFEYIVDGTQEETAIENAETSCKAEKIFVDGEIRIRKNGHLYSITGQVIE